MIGAFLIAVLALFKGEESPYNSSPCKETKNTEAYNNFVHRHVLKKGFNTSSTDDWEDYLTEQNLCGRPRQSFIDVGAEILYEEICNGFGVRQGGGNLCTSTCKVRLHDLNVTKTKSTTSGKNCTVYGLRSEYRYVTVACDKVGSQCLPVHFNSSQINMPENKNGTCEAQGSEGEQKISTSHWFQFLQMTFYS
uniref:Uncharacterized protein n=1 Tax=Poecilia formosa TaxID=48698 RepID=A0A096LVS2_POEFO